MYRNVPVGHKDYGKAFPCACFQEELDKRQRDQRFKRLDRESNIGEVERASLTFKEFDPAKAIPVPGQAPSKTTKILEATKVVCMRWAKKPEGFLTLWGPVGSGKTHLAVAIVNHRLYIGEPAVYFPVPEMLDVVRGGWKGDEHDYIEDLETVELLLLDDFGAENPTDWSNSTIFQILNHRYRQGLPTVVTTNYNMTTGVHPDTGKRMNPRILSRLRQSGKKRGSFPVLHVNAGDFRPYT